MAYCRDWREGRCTEYRGKCSDEPIHISAVKSSPVCGRLRRWREPYLRPDSPQGNQESAVHHTLQVSGKSHAHVGKVLLGEAPEQPEQKQEHPMPHQSPVGVFHVSSPTWNFHFEFM